MLFGRKAMYINSLNPDKTLRIGDSHVPWDESSGNTLGVGVELCHSSAVIFSGCPAEGIYSLKTRLLWADYPGEQGIGLKEVRMSSVLNLPLNSHSLVYSKSLVISRILKILILIPFATSFPYSREEKCWVSLHLTFCYVQHLNCAAPR